MSMTEASNLIETNAGAGFVAGQLAADPTEIGKQDEAGRILHDFPAALAFLKPAGADVEVVDLVEQLGKHREHPPRAIGTFKVHDAESFLAYLLSHKITDETEVWADASGTRIIGVLNAHQNCTSPVADTGPYAGWGDHLVTYDVLKTDAWKAWAQRDQVLMSQSDFAELIEMRMVDIVEPEAAYMLELAQSFQATIGVQFQSSKLLSSGERELTYKEDVQSSAGRSGQLEIPKDFVVALQPFEGAETYKVTARFRYRITEGRLSLGYVLVRPEDVLREAFLDVIATVDAGLGDSGVPLYRGVSA